MQSAIYTQWVEFGLINVIGWLTGFLTGQERRAKRKYQIALTVQKELVKKLKQEGLERERLEEEIRQTERLTALGHMNVVLAHEIRNPLGIMKVSIQLLAQSTMHMNTQMNDQMSNSQHIQGMAGTNQQNNSNTQKSSDKNMIGSMGR